MRWISPIGGLIATGAAILVLVSLPTGTQPPDATSSLTERTSSVEPVVQQLNVEQPIGHNLSVANLDEELVDVLAESGYTQFVGAGELFESLSDDIVQVLIREEAVLVIPSKEGR